jgi:hypothetical protein
MYNPINTLNNVILICSREIHFKNYQNIVQNYTILLAIACLIDINCFLLLNNHI